LSGLAGYYSVPEISDPPVSHGEYKVISVNIIRFPSTLEFVFFIPETVLLPDYQYPMINQDKDPYQNGRIHQVKCYGNVFVGPDPQAKIVI